MNALNRSSQMFSKLLFFNASVLFSMWLQRMALFLVVVRHWLFGADGMTITMSFVNGTRFDLCVLGFLNIPVLFIVWAISTDFLVNTPNKLLQFLRRWVLWSYLAVTTLVIHVLGLFDMMFFAVNHHRWTYFDWQAKGFNFLTNAVQSWGILFTFAVLLFFVLLWLFRCIFTLYRVQLHTLSLKSGQSKWSLLVLGVLLPLFVVALAARGTWTAHHINIEHSQVSQNQILNQMTLSPVWAFDKKF